MCIKSLEWSYSLFVLQKQQCLVVAEDQALTLGQQEMVDRGPLAEEQQ